MSSSPSNSRRHTVKSALSPSSALILGDDAAAWILECEERLRPPTVVADATWLETVLNPSSEIGKSKRSEMQGNLNSTL
jgi:hypothetical protein